MRILFTIPHYYDAQGGGRYGSLKPDARPRRAALAGTIGSLHAAFGRRQGLLRSPLRECNAAQSADIEVAVCTTRGRHVLDELPLPRELYTHHDTEAEPQFLGFECHEVLRRNLGRFDWYCYLEDDLALLDPLFFQKLAWFNGLAGDEAVLQPNRNEIAVSGPWHKLYIDGTLARREWSDRWQDVGDRPVIEAEAFGVPVRFLRVNNPHSGCFFLNARQMAHWARQADFLAREASFAPGPLESAATFGIMRHFRVYKPARDNAAFLEVRHLDNRYLGPGGRLGQTVASRP